MDGHLLVHVTVAPRVDVQRPRLDVRVPRMIERAGLPGLAARRVPLVRDLVAALTLHGIPARECVPVEEVRREDAVLAVDDDGGAVNSVDERLEGDVAATPRMHGGTPGTT